MSANAAVLELTALLRSGASHSIAREQFKYSKLSDYQKNQFEFIWKVANQSGGQLAVALDRLAQVFENQVRQFDELKVAFASPRATSNLILLLPILAVVFAELFGLSVLQASLGSILGIFALGIGLVLLIAARIFSLRMLERAKPKESDPGAFLDAVVIGLSAGLSAKAASDLARTKILEQFDSKVSPDQLQLFWEAQKVSESSGIALTGILTARADALRQKLWTNARAELARLQITLMIPLGLAALPAFVLLAIIPLGIGLFSD